MPTAPDGSSLFNAVPFDWESKTLARATVEGIVRLTGTMLLYNPTDLAAMETLFRPCTFIAPASGLERAYIRFFGTNPAHTLITPGARDLADDGGWVVRKTCSAILYEFVATADFGGIYHAQVAFALTTAETVYDPGP